MNRHRKTSYRFTGSALPRTRRWSLGLAATVMLTFLAITGTAAAGTAKTGSASTVYSAAHAQYGHQHVVKPTQAPKSGVLGAVHAQVAKTKTVAAKPLPAQKVSGTLPFTGISLLRVLLIGLATVSLGVMLRRQTSRPSGK